MSFSIPVLIAEDELRFVSEARTLGPYFGTAIAAGFCFVALGNEFSI